MSMQVLTGPISHAIIKLLDFILSILSVGLPITKFTHALLNILFLINAGLIG